MYSPNYLTDFIFVLHAYFNTFKVALAVLSANQQPVEQSKVSPVIKLDSTTRNQYQIYEIAFKIDKSQFKKAPGFTDITGYLNTNSSNLRLIDLRGKVVLVHFWTYNCSNCIHTIPHLNEWYQKYANKGFTIGVFKHLNLILKRISMM
jgi:thiol-disulfide isomerase/thioredoxin